MTRPLERLMIQSDNETQVDYSENWAGAVLTSPPSGETFNGVSASFTVPTPAVPSGKSKRGTYSASAWVGIDGDTCQNAILQTGIDFTISDGQISYDAWYEWLPDYAYDFSGISFSAGDIVTVSVYASSLTSGTATIENNSNGEKVSQSITSSSSLCGENAEWIVEDYQQDDSLVPLCDWGTVTFTDCTATTAKSSLVASGADILDIEQNNKILTSASGGGSSVSVSYV